MRSAAEAGAGQQAARPACAAARVFLCQVAPGGNRPNRVEKALARGLGQPVPHQRDAQPGDVVAAAQIEPGMGVGAQCAAAKIGRAGDGRLRVEERDIGAAPGGKADEQPRPEGPGQERERLALAQPVEPGAARGGGRGQDQDQAELRCSRGALREMAGKAEAVEALRLEIDEALRAAQQHGMRGLDLVGEPARCDRPGKARARAGQRAQQPLRGGHGARARGEGGKAVEMAARLGHHRALGAQEQAAPCPRAGRGGRQEQSPVVDQRQGLAVAAREEAEGPPAALRARGGMGQARHRQPAGQAARLGRLRDRGEGGCRLGTRGRIECDRDRDPAAQQVVQQIRPARAKQACPGREQRARRINAREAGGKAVAGIKHRGLEGEARLGAVRLPADPPTGVDARLSEPFHNPSRSAAAKVLRDELGCRRPVPG
ncbi:hypothetical protein SDC9_06575 [bioreactor metagenome]|uniref:Uncharacterized protein n=1 Tax=bioreactor metagenome TaxID=1076179 RepID=A0A644T2M8_9ZZZZ